MDDNHCCCKRLCVVLQFYQYIYQDGSPEVWMENQRDNIGLQLTAREQECVITLYIDLSR